MNLFPPYEVIAGCVIRFSLAFTDINNVAIDPSVVTAVVGTPGSTSTTLVVVHDGIGQYHADWDTSLASTGMYYCLVKGTGVLTTANEIGVRIFKSQLS